jgi:hypothetical protein
MTYVIICIIQFVADSTKANDTPKRQIGSARSGGWRSGLCLQRPVIGAIAIIKAELLWRPCR